MDGFVVEATTPLDLNLFDLPTLSHHPSGQISNLDCPCCYCGFHIPILPVVVLSQHLHFFVYLFV